MSTAGLAAALVHYGPRAEVGLRCVLVRQSGLPKAGNGLYCGGVAFERGELITEYDGETLSLAAAKASPVQTHFARLAYGLVISGLRVPVSGRGGGSFANDCRSKPGYNAESCARLGKLYLRALRRIEPGEEIFWRYGNQVAFEVAMGTRRL